MAIDYGMDFVRIGCDVDKVNDLEKFVILENKSLLFDSALKSFKEYDKFSFGDSYISNIKISDFEKYYRVALKIDQEYFLIGSKDEWKEYYLKNNSSLFRDNLNLKLLEKLKSKTIEWI